MPPSNASNDREPAVREGEAGREGGSGRSVGEARAVGIARVGIAAPAGVQLQVLGMRTGRGCHQGLYAEGAFACAPRSRIRAGEGAVAALLEAVTGDVHLAAGRRASSRTARAALSRSGAGLGGRRVIDARVHVGVERVVFELRRAAEQAGEEERGEKEEREEDRGRTFFHEKALRATGARRSRILTYRRHRGVPARASPRTAALSPTGDTRIAVASCARTDPAGFAGASRATHCEDELVVARTTSQEVPSVELSAHAGASRDWQ